MIGDDDLAALIRWLRTQNISPTGIAIEAAKNALKEMEGEAVDKVKAEIAKIKQRMKDGV